jgi:hypothetical protein
MWQEVSSYVLQRATLPIGPLRDDLETRQNIALKVIERLEREQFKHVRRWRERQRRRKGHSSWWGWIQVIASKIAIDVARLSRENIGSRGEPFQWVKVLPTDPALIDGGTAEVRDYLDDLQRAARENDDDSGSGGGNGGGNGGENGGEPENGARSKSVKRR